MPHTTTARSNLTPASLIDEVMGVLARGESALFADLANAAWQPQATLASLAGSLPGRDQSSTQRDVA